MKNNEVVINIRINLLLVLTAMFTTTTVAGPHDDDFEEYIFNICANANPVVLASEGWTVGEINDLNNVCLDVLPGGGTPSSDDYVSSSNIGSRGAQSRTSNAAASNQVDSVKGRQEELEQEGDTSAGWGLLVAVQKGETDRVESENESGYESELTGIVVGMDYRFNDMLVMGVAAGFTTDEADFDNNTGNLDTDSSSVTLYFTVVPFENAYVDGYLGMSDLEYSSVREISFEGTVADPTNILGTARADFDGEQDLAGASAGYDWYVGDFSVGPFVAVDYISTDIDRYREDGGATPTGLELAYTDQSNSSRTSRLGINLSYTAGFGWGVVMPTFSMARVHESDDDARSFVTKMSALPDDKDTTLFETTFSFATDDPDKDYNQSSIGLVAAMNSGTQFFITYEQISAHEFLDTWSVSVGALTEF